MNPKAQLTDEERIQIATEYALGKSARELAQRYNVTRTTVEKVLKSPMGLKVTDSTVETAVKRAVSSLRYELASLVPLAVQTIRKALEEGNLQAIPHFFKALGVEVKEDKAEAAQNITVILPGAEAPRNEIDITPESEVQ